MMQVLAQSVRRDTQGVTAVEFGLIAPVLLLMLMGLFDMAYTMYTDALLEGEVQQAARDSTIEGADGREAELDANVTNVVHKLAPRAELSFKRSAYEDFDDVGRPEDFTDANGNGSCDNGEAFEDANGNDAWDSDRGSDGFGAARDAVLYEVTINYPRPFPVTSFIGLDPNVTLVARTVLRNQPYGDVENEPKVGNCE